MAKIIYTYMMVCPHKPLKYKSQRETASDAREEFYLPLSGHRCRKDRDFLVSLLRVSKVTSVHFLNCFGVFFFKFARLLSPSLTIPKSNSTSRVGNLERSCRVPAAPPYKQQHQCSGQQEPSGNGPLCKSRLAWLVWPSIYSQALPVPAKYQS